MGASGSWPLIICYHHITSGPSSRYSLSVTTFERHLVGLLRRGYHAVSLPDALGADGPARSFTLTFDDGLASLAELALPVLERLDLVGATTAFVPTAYVGQRNAWRSAPTALDRLRRRADPEAALMGWDDLAMLAERGARIESHGHGHLAMNALTYDAALAEASASRAALAEHGFESRYLALPFGWHSPECKRAIADAGFSAAFSVTGGGLDDFEVRRIPLYGTDGPAVRAIKLSGRYWSLFDAAATAVGRRRRR